MKILKRNPPFWGVIGTTLLTIGTLSMISLTIKGSSLYLLILMGSIAVIGMLVIAWVFGEINEYQY